MRCHCLWNQESYSRIQPNQHLARCDSSPRQSRSRGSSALTPARRRRAWQRRRATKRGGGGTNKLLPAAPRGSAEPVSARAPLRELREPPDGPGAAETSYRDGEKIGGGVERFSSQPELRPEPGTEDLIRKDLRNLKPFRNILFFLRHHMG